MEIWTSLIDIKIKSENRRILDRVDGWVKPGTLTALMGVTGAGKTSLLDVLADPHRELLARERVLVLAEQREAHRAEG